MILTTVAWLWTQIQPNLRYLSFSYHFVPVALCLMTFIFELGTVSLGMFALSEQCFPIDNKLLNFGK